MLIYTERQYQRYVHADASDQFGDATHFGVTQWVHKEMYKQQMGAILLATSLTLSVNVPLQFHINNMSNCMIKSQGVAVSPFVSEFTVQVVSLFFVAFMVSSYLNNRKS